MISLNTGNYQIKAQYNNSSCDVNDSVVIEYYDDKAAGKADDMVVCDNVGVSSFDLTKNTASLLSTYTAADDKHEVTYFVSSADAKGLKNAVGTPTAFQNSVSPQTIYARVQNTNSGCYQVVEFQLIVQDFTPKFTLSGDTKVCPTETTTIAVAPTDNNFDPSKVTYTWAYKGAVLPAETGSSIKLTGTAAVGTYTVTVNNSGCVSSQDFEITADTTALDINLEGGCSLNDYLLVASSVNGSFNADTSTFEWIAENGGSFSATDKKNIIGLKSIGTYKVKVTTAEGCSSDESVTVTDISCNIQKGISPGSNTKNSSFDLTSLNVKRLEIFNRYGSEVYSLDNYTNEWHGQSTGGSDLPDGTYFYQIHFKDNSKVTTGWIYINRKQ